MLKFKKHDDKPKDKDSDKEKEKEKETKSTHRSRSPVRRRSRSPPRRRSRSPSRRDRSPVRYSSRSPPRRRSRSPRRRSPRRRSPRRDERRSKDRSRSRSPPKPTTTTRDANQGVKRVYKKKPQYNLIEVEVNDRLGKKVRVKCSPDDSVGDFKKLLSAQIGTPAAKIVLKKWYKEYKDHISLSDYEIHDGMNLELYYR